MSAVDVWLVGKSELETLYSQVLDLVVISLIDDGLLAEDAGTMWAAYHTVIVRKTSRLSRWVKKLLSLPADDNYRMMIVALAKESKGQDKKSLLGPLEGGQKE